jgi:hypothetical protein
MLHQEPILTHALGTRIILQKEKATLYVEHDFNPISAGVVVVGVVDRSCRKIVACVQIVRCGYHRYSKPVRRLVCEYLPELAQALDTVLCGWKGGCKK